jgi:hypothetical protein
VFTPQQLQQLMLLNSQLLGQAVQQPHGQVQTGVNAGTAGGGIYGILNVNGSSSIAGAAANGVGAATAGMGMGVGMADAGGGGGNGGGGSGMQMGLAGAEGLGQPVGYTYTGF